MNQKAKELAEELIVEHAASYPEVPLSVIKSIIAYELYQEDNIEKNKVKKIHSFFEYLQKIYEEKRKKGKK